MINEVGRLGAGCEESRSAKTREGEPHHTPACDTSASSDAATECRGRHNNSHAVVAVAPYKVAFQTVTTPEPTSDDVVVRIEYSWISNGTESSFIRGERIQGDTPWENGDPSPFPHMPGYQKCGVVEWVGSNVKNLRTGDRKTVSLNSSVKLNKNKLAAARCAALRTCLPRVVRQRYISASYIV